MPSASQSLMTPSSQNVSHSLDSSSSSSQSQSQSQSPYSPTHGTHTPLPTTLHSSSLNHPISISANPQPPLSTVSTTSRDQNPTLKGAPTPPLSLSNTSGHRDDHIPVSSSDPSSSIDNDNNMIVVQSSPRPNRGSYLDMDDDNAGSNSNKASGFNPFRRFLVQTVTSSSTSQPVAADSPSLSPAISSSPPQHPSPSTFPLRSSNESSRPFPSFSNMESSTSSQTFPLVSPPQSPTTRSRRSRPSLDGVFDSPSPPPRNSDGSVTGGSARTSRELSRVSPSPPYTNSNPQSPDHRNTKFSFTPSISSAASGTASTSTTRRIARTSRPIPHGENPLIFGNVSPRRVSKSVTSPLGDVSAGEASDLLVPAFSITGPTPEPSPSKPQHQLHPTLGTLRESSPSPNFVSSESEKTSSPQPTISALRPFGSLKSSPPKTVTYEDEVNAIKDAKTLGKRKSEELDVAIDLGRDPGKDRPVEKSRKGSIRTSHIPSAAVSAGGDAIFTTSGSALGPSGTTPSARRNSSKRIKLSPTSQLGLPTNSQHGHDTSILTATSDNPDSKYNSLTSQGHNQSSPPIIPSASASRPGSLRPSTKAKSTRASFFNPSSSQGSLPLSAIMSPRPPSIVHSDYTYGYGREEGVFMRDPRMGKGLDNVGWGVRFFTRSESQQGAADSAGAAMLTLQKEMPTPMPGLLFYPGFLVPILWIIGALLKDPSSQKTRRKGLYSTSLTRAEQEKNPSTRKEESEETAVSVSTSHPAAAAADIIKWDQRSYQLRRMREKAYKTWRDRCRFMAIVSLVTYLPLIVLLAIYVPK